MIEKYGSEFEKFGEIMAERLEVRKFDKMMKLLNSRPPKEQIFKRSPQEKLKFYWVGAIDVATGGTKGTVHPPPLRIEGPKKA